MIPGRAKVVIFKDHRVRAKFKDNTIVRIDSSLQVAEVVLPSGKVNTVLCSNPIGVREYVDPLVRWANLVTLPPTARIAAEAAASERTALLEGALGRTERFLATQKIFHEMEEAARNEDAHENEIFLEEDISGAMLSRRAREAVEATETFLREIGSNIASIA